jgi:glutaredoxin-like protein
MEKLITEDIAAQVREIFEEIGAPVEIDFFSKKDRCQYCGEVEQLVNEVSELSEKITVKVFDVNDDVKLAEKYGVVDAPTLVILAKEGEEVVDYGVRLMGAPAGHEFTTLIHDILMVSARKAELTEDTLAFLEGLTEPILLQVFVTPTCPYCPQAVLLAHKLALESEWVQAEMVESTEFYDLASKFQVSGVPQTTINSGKGRVVGAVPEQALVQQIQAALVK